MSLAGIFPFTLDDLSANYAGQLSAVQRQRLQWERYTLWGVIGLLSLLAMGGYFSSSSIIVNFASVVLIVIALITFVSWIRLEWSLWENRVVSIQGTPQFSYHRRRYYLKIAGYSFPISQAQYEAINPHRMYRVYMPSKYAELLTIEEV